MKKFIMFLRKMLPFFPVLGLVVGLALVFPIYRYEKFSPSLAFAILGGVIFVMTVVSQWFALKEESSDSRQHNVVYENIKAHCQSNDNLSAEDVIRIGRASECSKEEIYKVMLQLFSTSHDNAQMQICLKKLLDRFETELPYEDIPSATKQSMFRLAELCTSSGKDSDKALVNDMHSHLRQYRVMQKDHEKIKIQAKRSYYIGIFGLITGILFAMLSFIFALKKKDITEAIHESLNSYTNTVYMAKPAEESSFTQ